MAIPLVAILGYVAYTRFVADDTPGDAWQTYRNERFKYEFRYPPDWKIIYEFESLDQTGEHQTVVFAREWPSPSAPGVRPRPNVFASVNLPGGSCEGVSRSEQREITVSGVTGVEYNCFIGPPQSDSCAPKPQCVEEPWTIYRLLGRNDLRFYIGGDAQPGVLTPNDNPNINADHDAAATTKTIRKMLDSYRFID